MHPKPNLSHKDSVIDSHLTVECADAFARQLDAGLPLHEAADLLQREHQITVSRSVICRWAAKRRRVRSHRSFRRLLASLDADQAQAADIDGALGEKTMLSANAAIVAQALYQAGRDGNDHAIARAARNFAAVMSAIARTRLADTARRRFEFDAAKAARKHAKAFVEIARARDPDEHAKIQRVIERLFGRPPAHQLEEEERAEARRLLAEFDPAI